MKTHHWTLNEFCSLLITVPLPARFELRIPNVPLDRRRVPLLPGYGELVFSLKGNGTLDGNFSPINLGEFTGIDAKYEVIRRLEQFQTRGC